MWPSFGGRHNDIGNTYALMALFTYAAALVPLLPYPTNFENKVCPLGGFSTPPLPGVTPSNIPKRQKGVISCRVSPSPLSGWQKAGVLPLPRFALKKATHPASPF